MTINTAEIEARLAKATPGPWSTERPGVDPGTGFRNGCVIAAVGPRQAIYADPPGGSYPEDDRKFIAHAWADIRDLLAALKAETARADEAEALIYVPGLWRCAKCEFTLLQSNLNMGDGTITARDTPGDKCPNCDSPLWRVSEREQRKELMAEHEKEWERAQSLQSQLTAANEKLAAARELVRKLGDPLLEICDHLEDEGDRVYLGSTNHADTLKGVQQSYWAWWLQEEIDAGRLDTPHTTGDGNGRSLIGIARIREIIALI